MREFKFRAWHEGYNGIQPRMLYDEKPGDCLVYKSQGQPVTVMQFTGLVDKNGKEIYESDKVKDAIGNVWEVRFSNGAFRVDNGMPLGSFTVGLEIIGNLYEG